MKKLILTAVSLTSVLLIAGCGKAEDKTPASREKIAKKLSEFDLDQVISYDFVDRTYSYLYYNNAKYVVSGAGSSGIINYEARHQFQLFKNQMITDSIEVDGLVDVAASKVDFTIPAEGQIFVQNGYIYDYFICDSMKDQSYVNCYETDVYNTFEDYFNYLSIITTARYAFNDPSTYFPSDSDYTQPLLEIKEQDGIEIYDLESSYPGDNTYRPYTISFHVEYDKKAKEFISVSYQERAMKNDLSDDYETGTSSLIRYTIRNIKFGEKENYSGTYCSYDDIQDKNKIHDAPNEVVDVSHLEDGKLDDEVTLDIIRKIDAYSNDVRETQYSMIYHNAFDFANTDQTELGAMMFSGKITAYSDNITDNIGYMQKVDQDDSPIDGTKANYRIFTKAMEEYIIRGGIFDKYITSSMAGVLKSQVNRARAYLDANPLYWNEIYNIYSGFINYELGKTNLDGGSSFQVAVSGTKKGTHLEIKGELHKKVNGGNNVENIDSFTFIIDNDKLTSLVFVAKGNTQADGPYTDTYMANFVHGTKKPFDGVEMDFDTIDTQVTMESFNIIG